MIKKKQNIIRTSCFAVIAILIVLMLSSYFGDRSYVLAQTNSPFAATGTYVMSVLLTRSAPTNEPAVFATNTPSGTTNSLEQAYLEIEGVLEVHIVSVLGSNPTIVYSEIAVEPGYQNTGTADILMQIAMAELVTASLDFSTILDDGQTAPVSYRWDNQQDTWETTAMSAAATYAATHLPSETTLYTTGLANVRTCPHTSCDALIQFQSGQAVIAIGSISGEPVNPDNDVWYEIEYEDTTAFIYGGVVSPYRPTSNVTTNNSSSSSSSSSSPVNTAPSSSNQSSGPATGTTSFICPRNCTEAVAMGLTAEQAGTCSNLDRDHDGVACYGN